MKAIIVVVLLMAIAVPASAEQQQQQADTADRAAQMRRGRMFMWIGFGLIGGGAVIASTREAEDPAIMTGVGLAASGGILALWGAKAQRQASRPHTTVGVSLGRTNGVQIRRSW